MRQKLAMARNGIDPTGNIAPLPSAMRETDTENMLGMPMDPKAVTRL